MTCRPTYRKKWKQDSGESKMGRTAYLRIYFVLFLDLNLGDGSDEWAECEVVDHHTLNFFSLVPNVTTLN